MATYSQDPVTITVSSSPVAGGAQDSIGTGGGTAPVVSAQIPANGATGVSPDAAISFEVD